MELEKHEEALIWSYRQIDRKRRQIIWHVIQGGMRQRGLRIFFNH